MDYNFNDFFRNNHNKNLVLLNTVLEDEDFSQTIIVYKVDKEEGLIEEFNSWDYESLRKFDVNLSNLPQIAEKLKEKGLTQLVSVPVNLNYVKFLRNLNIKGEFDFDEDFNGDDEIVNYYTFEPLFCNEKLCNLLSKKGIKLETIITH